MGRQQEAPKRPARGYGPAEQSRGTSPAAEAASSLPEIIRIAAWRRWYFVVPACLGAALCMASSLFWPRQYTARCVIERRDDLSLSSIVSANSPFSFQTYRMGLPVELYGFEAVKAALEAVGLSQGLPRDAHGVLTVEGQQRLQDLAQRVAKKIDLAFLQKSDRLDLVEVSFKWSDPVIAQKLLTKLKDNYIERTRNIIVENMQKAREFFQREVKSWSDKVAAAEADLDRIKVDAGGDPGSPGFLEGEVMKLEAEKTMLLQKKREHDRSLKSAQKSLENIESLLAGVTTRATATASTTALAPPTDSAQLIVQLEKEIRDIEDTIDNNRHFRNMTAQHPDQIALTAKRDKKKAQLEKVRRELPTGTSPSPAPSGPMDYQALLLERQKSQSYIALVQELLADVVADVNEVDARIAAWESRKPKRIEAQQKYRIRMKEYERDHAEERKWQDWLDQVNRFLSAEVSQRGIQLTTKEEAQLGLKATSPTFVWVLLISLAAGAAVGVGVVVLAEFFDRSFRTATQVARVLGMPVLESIDEIPTPELKLRRFVRRAVIMPAVGTALAVMLLGSLSVAYISLEQPERYQRWRASPRLVVDDLVQMVRPQ